MNVFLDLNIFLGLSEWSIILMAIIFVLSGFIRSGIGFGGALVALPFILLIDNRPLVYLPIIAVHLLFFAAMTLWQNSRSKSDRSKQEGDHFSGTVDWAYLKKALMVMIIPKLIGVTGLLTIPAGVMTGIIFSIVSVYSVTYIVNKPFKSTSPWLDKLFLILGAYISGTSLIGAPLIIAVFATHVARQQLRDTLFVLWFILVSIKMVAFVVAGVNLQWAAHLWLLPAAGVGHVLGLKFHDYLNRGDSVRFFRYLGISLLATSLLGIASLWMK